MGDPRDLATTPATRPPPSRARPLPTLPMGGATPRCVQRTTRAKMGLRRAVMRRADGHDKSDLCGEARSHERSPGARARRPRSRMKVASVSGCRASTVSRTT